MIRFSLWLLAFTITSCTFKIDLTSQRTSIENQIIGTQKQLDEDVILISSVRAVDSSGSIKKVNRSQRQKLAVRAKQNRQFNQDDIIELKNEGILGELAIGELAILPTDIRTKDISRKQLRLAEVIVAEENRDRQIIWQRMVEMNPELDESHLPVIRKTFAQQIFEVAYIGHWFKQNDKWTQKTK